MRTETSLCSQWRPYGWEHVQLCCLDKLLLTLPSRDARQCISTTDPIPDSGCRGLLHIHQHNYMLQRPGLSLTIYEKPSPPPLFTSYFFHPHKSFFKNVQALIPTH